ncbi:GEM-like protein 2, partial [Mucuna pruriens]
MLFLLFPISLIICIQIHISILAPTFFSNYSPCIPSCPFLFVPVISTFTFTHILFFFSYLSLPSSIPLSIHWCKLSLGFLNKRMSNHREIAVTASTNSISSNNPYVYISSAPLPSAPAKRPSPMMDTIYGALNHYSKKVEEATKQAEIMVLASGGPDKLFQQTFGVFPREKLLQKPYSCYVSTNSGPVIGTLYVSTKRLAFCSDYPLCHHPLSLQQHQCIYYKVIVQLDQLKKVSSATNGLNPTEKSMQVFTTDGYEFNFMGFLSYDNAFKTVNEALQH